MNPDELEAALERLLADAPADQMEMMGGEFPEDDRLPREEHPYAWLLNPHIQGIGVAQRERGGEVVEGEWVIQVLVDEKLPPDHLFRGVPRTVYVRGVSEPLPLDVVEVGEFVTEALDDGVRPVPGGFSVRRPDGLPGTMGCYVLSQSNNVYALGCAHVLAGTPHPRLNDPIVQPPNVAPGPDTQIAALRVWSPLQPSAPQVYPHRLDAALAIMRHPLPDYVDPRIALYGYHNGVGPVPYRTMPVQKVGAYSEATRGRVTKDKPMRLRITIKYAGRRPFKAGFRGQGLANYDSSNGDSGAAVMDANGRVIGLHIASNTTKTLAVFTPIETILRYFNVRLLRRLDEVVPAAPPL